MDRERLGSQGLRERERVPGNRSGGSEDDREKEMARPRRDSHPWDSPGAPDERGLRFARKQPGDDST